MRSLIIPSSGSAALKARVVETITGTGTGSTMSVTLPTNLAGKHVWVVTAVNGSVENPTTPSGWTATFANNATAAGDEWHMYTRLCDGSEGSSLSISKSGTNFYSYLVLSIENTYVGGEEGVLPNNQTGSTVTPSAVGGTFSPSCWITLLCCNQVNITTYPSNMSDINTRTTGGSSSQPMIAAAVLHGDPTAGSFSPNSWTLASSQACTMRSYSVAGG